MQVPEAVGRETGDKGLCEREEEGEERKKGAREGVGERKLKVERKKNEEGRK